MNKSKILALLLALTLIASVGLTACGGTEDTNGNEEQTQTTDNNGEEKLAEEQVLKVNLGEEPPCLDPQISTDTTSSEIIQDISEGIIRMDKSGEVKEGSGMALNWDINEDGTVYTFHLRDAVWSDGVSVTAKNFEFAWERVIDPEVASDYSFMAYDILNAKEYSNGEISDIKEVGIEAVDDKTLKVTLKAPNPVFVSKLQHSTFFPAREDLIEEYGDKYASEAHLVPSCGPFKVAEWAHESKIVLEKNDQYWDAEAVKLEEIQFLIIKNSNSQMGMYKTGQLDYTGIPSQFLDQYKDKLERYNTAATYYYLINNEDQYFKNAKLRKALRMAIDQTKVYAVKRQGMMDAAYAWIPPGIPGYDGKTFREIAGQELYQDIGTGATQEEIQALVAEAVEELGITMDDLDGYANYLTSESDTALQYAEIYQQMIEENAGFKTGIEQSTWKVRLQRYKEGDFVYSAMGWVGDYNDAMTFMDLFLSDSPQNRARYASEEYDAYVKKAQTSYEQKERVDAMIAAEKIFMEDYPIAPYAYGTKIYVQESYVKDIVRLPLGVYDGKKWAYILEH